MLRFFRYPPLSIWARSPAATPCPPPLVLQLSATPCLPPGGYSLSHFPSLRLSATPYPPPSATFSLSQLRYVDWASSTKISTVMHSIPLTHLVVRCLKCEVRAILFDISSVPIWYHFFSLKEHFKINNNKIWFILFRIIDTPSEYVPDWDLPLDNYLANDLKILLLLLRFSDAAQVWYAFD